jgi:hypothetical protein
MKYPQTTQENKIITISGKINSYSNDELISMTKFVSPNWEHLSTSKAKEALQFYPSRSFSQVIDNLDSARAAMARMAKRSYQKMLESDRREEYLLKAAKYNINIPYEENYINWLELIDIIDEYELLLAEAEGYNINWDISQYDPVALTQEIEYIRRSETEGRNDIQRDYLESRI